MCQVYSVDLYNVQPNTCKTVQINDVEPEVFEQMLYYLYTGVVPKMKELAELLLVAADKYQFESLKQECEQYLISVLSLDDVIHHLELAKVLSASKLLEASLLHVRQNMKELWTSRDWQELGERNFPFFFWVCQRIIGDLDQTSPCEDLHKSALLLGPLPFTCLQAH